MGKVIAMQQKMPDGPCAWSRACNLPGERWTDPNTGRKYCPTHTAELTSPLARDAKGSSSLIRPQPKGRRNSGVSGGPLNRNFWVRSGVIAD
jgi:hypothetical protein